MQKILLQLKNISVRYGGVHVLEDVDFQVDEGEVVALMGPNGAGKSTILRAIFGLAPLSHGEILWHGRPLHPVPHQMSELGIVFVPQGKRVFGNLTVEENLEMGALRATSNELRATRKEEMFELFPILRQKRKVRASLLSGGQQQMLALARGLMSDPKLLLLDEPSLGLSPKFVKEIFEKIQEVHQNRQVALVVVEHNIRSLLDLADRAYVLDKGRVVAYDTAQKIKQSDILEKIFLGVR